MQASANSDPIFVATDEKLSKFQLTLCKRALGVVRSSVNSFDSPSIAKIKKSFDLKTFALSETIDFGTP